MIGYDATPEGLKQIRELKMIPRAEAVRLLSGGKSPLKRTPYLNAVLKFGIDNEVKLRSSFEAFKKETGDTETVFIQFVFAMAAVAHIDNVNQSKL